MTNKEIAERVYEILKDQKTHTHEEVAAKAGITRDELRKALSPQLPPLPKR